MQTEGKFLTPNCNEVCDGIMRSGSTQHFVVTNVLICRKKWNKKKLVKNKDRWKASQLITINNYNRLRNDLPSESLSSAQLQFVKSDNQVRKQDTLF